MRIIKTIIVNAVVGIMIGSTITLCMIAMQVGSTTLESKHILECFIMYALIGVLTAIFKTDRLPYSLLIGLHMLGTLLIVIGSSLIFNWGWLTSNDVPIFMTIFVIIYAGVWIGVYINSQITSHKLNQRLKVRNKN
ncbi:DUF3021 domain-containing protein [Lentilactobacillus kosonis]|uniref:DUF3021 domain-containing protein n=1 Tax=Lentilactobacillus kosonis TaxID=2810561 RepID=A0A401FHN6_9LACO|nr:DUF3021 domain-containing protein [Lentilactobacillus kosonis]GAY71873.1 hypothetical protein NBRC111893_19 [Lentilactobacillus kosonis]